MDDEAKFWFRCLVAILLAVVLAIFGGVFINCWHMHRMAELGYEERIVPGRQSTLWQKLPQPPVRCDCPRAWVEPLVTTTNYVQEVERYWTTNAFSTLADYLVSSNGMIISTRDD